MIPILKEREDKYYSPLLLLRYFLKPEKTYKLKELKEKISLTKDCFEERYYVLREIYKGRFEHFDKENLMKKYEEMINRKRDLKDRIKLVKDIKKNTNLFEKKRAKRLLEDITEELERRERAIKDVLTEFKRRKIDLEQHYMK